MSFNQLANCSNCGKVFVKGAREICHACLKLEEDEFKKVSTFLRKPENRGSTLEEVSEATEVSVKQITRFIKQGRLTIDELPNMSYPCESCGEPTKTGTLCLNCRKGFTDSVKKLHEVEEAERERERERQRQMGYQQIKARINQMRK